MRIVLLCNRTLSEFDLAVLGHILNCAELKLIGIVINTRAKPSLWKRVKREWRKGRGGYVFIQIINGLLSRLRKSHAMSAVQFAEKHHVSFMESDSLYKPPVSEWIQNLKPDILFLRGFGIIKEPILSVAPFGVLSYHHGDLRKYRGGPPAFWELYHRENSVGVTLQILDAGLDTGTIVLQKFVPIDRKDTWDRLKERLYRESESMAAEALIKLLETGPVRNPVGEAGRLFTLPNLREWLTLQVQIFFRKIRA